MSVYTAIAEELLEKAKVQKPPYVQRVIAYALVSIAQSLEVIILRMERK